MYDVYHLMIYKMKKKILIKVGKKLFDLNFAENLFSHRVINENKYEKMLPFNWNHSI